MTLTVTEKEIAAMTSKDIAEIAARLERQEYKSAFEELPDWHLLRAIIFCLLYTSPSPRDS